MEPDVSLPHSQVPTICPHHEQYQTISPEPRPCWIIHNTICVYGEEFLAPRPNPKLEDQ